MKGSGVKCSEVRSGVKRRVKRSEERSDVKGSVVRRSEAKWSKEKCRAVT